MNKCVRCGKLTDEPLRTRVAYNLGVSDDPSIPNDWKICIPCIKDIDSILGDFGVIGHSFKEETK